MGSNKGAADRFSGAMENLIQLSESMQQASALLADEDGEAETPKSGTSFLTVVPLGNMVCCWARLHFVFLVFREMCFCSF
jgi:hypothetical protein